MGNGWTNFLAGELGPAPPYPGLGSFSAGGKSFEIPDVLDIKIPEEKQQWFEERYKFLKQRYPYRQDRDIVQFLLTEMEYQKAPQIGPKEGPAESSRGIFSGIKDANASIGDWLMQNLVPGVEITKQEPGWLPKKSPVTFGWKGAAPTSTAEGPLEAPKARTIMPTLPPFVRDMQAGTSPTYNVTPQAERPGVAAQIAQDPGDYISRHPELLKEPQLPTQAPPQLPSQPRMQIPPPPERPDYAGRLRGMADAMPKTTEDILPRPMAPKFKNIWLEAIRYALPAATGQDPAKVEAERQRPLDEQWVKDLGVATARLDAKTKAEVSILAQDMLDYNTANSEYRGLLTELVKRYPGMANNPDTLRAIMSTFHITGKSIDAFMESLKREDGTVDLGLDPKEQKIQEIKTQVEILKEFLPGVPDELLVEKVFGGGFTRTIDQIKGSLVSIIMDEKAPPERKALAQKQLNTLNTALKETEVDQLDKDMLALEKLRPHISKEDYSMLAASTIKHRFHVPEPKEEKGEKALEKQRQFQHTQTTTGEMGVFFSAYPEYLKDTTGEATRAKIEEWDTAKQKYKVGIGQLEIMSKGKQLNPTQVSKYWEKVLSPRELGLLEDIKTGHKKYVMRDMTTGKMRMDQDSRPRAEIITATGGNLTVEQWEWLTFLIDQGMSNKKILEILGTPR